MKVIGFETMQKLVFVSFGILIVALICAVFFGYVLSSQMSSFYTDLLRMAADPQISAVDMAKYMNLLDKYEWAWYAPRIVGTVFAVVAAIASILTAVLIMKKS